MVGRYPPRPAMDEIIALQAALATAQAKTSSVRLSESNVIELVNKLKSIGLLDNTLLYTLNGKEYLTELRLDEEIRREVTLRGGRVQITDLPPALNVDVVHCERRARVLASDKANEIDLVEGELITPKYFDDVAKEIDEELREYGVVQVGELARRHQVSHELMTKEIRKRMLGQGSNREDSTTRSSPKTNAIDGVLESGSVYTPEYVRRIKAQLRGAMRAALVPTTRDALVNSALRVQDRAGDVASAALTGAVLGDLAKQGKGKHEGDKNNANGDGTQTIVADGALRGGAWHPAVYSRARATAVAALYQSAGLVTVEQAKRMGVEDCGAYFKELDGAEENENEIDETEKKGKGKGISLPESFVSRQLVDAFDAAVREALVENRGWCECDLLVPTDLPVNDAPFLLSAVSAVGGNESDAKKGKNNKADKKEKKAKTETETGTEIVAFVVKSPDASLVACATPSFLERVRVLAAEFGTKRGEEEGTRRQLAGVDRGDQAEAKEHETNPDSLEPKTGRKKESNPTRDDDKDADSAFAVTTEDLESDDEDTGGKRGKGKKGKGKKNSAGSGGKSNQALGGKEKNGIQKSSDLKKSKADDAADENAPTVFDVVNFLRPVTAGASDAFLDTVSCDVLTVCQNAFAKAVKQTLASASASTTTTLAKATQRAATERFDALYPAARAFSKGAALLRLDVFAQTHCCLTKVVPAADAFLFAYVEWHIPNVSVEGDQTFSLTKTQRDELANSGFPKRARGAAAELATACSSGNDPVSILEAIEALHSALLEQAGRGAPKLKGGDRKTERGVVQAHKKGLEQVLEREENFQKAFAVAVTLLICIAKGRAVSLTGRSLGGALDLFGDGNVCHGAVTIEDLAVLKKFHGNVVASLTEGRKKESDTKKETGETEDKNDLAELKRIVSVCQKVLDKGEGGEDAS